MIVGTTHVRFAEGIVIVLITLCCAMGQEKCDHNDTLGSQTNDFSKPQAPINVDLSVTGTPALGKTVEVALVAIPLVDAPNTSVTIDLPDGFELVEGDVAWSGHISAGQEVRIEVSVKPVKTGDFVVKGTALSEQGGYTFGRSASLYISVYESTATVSDTPPLNNWVQNDMVIPLNQRDEAIYSVLSLELEPVLGRDVKLLYSITPSIDLLDAEVSIVLPKLGIEMVDLTEVNIHGVSRKESTRQGVLSWKGDLRKDETFHIEAMLRSVLTGNGYVSAFVKGRSSDNEIVSKVNRLFIFVNPQSAIVTQDEQG